MHASFDCNCDLICKASNLDIEIDQNNSQLFTSLILKWTLGLVAMFHVFNVWYDVLGWMLMEQTHVYEHLFVFLSSDFCDICFPSKVYVEFWSQHLSINVELNNENILF